MSRKFSLSPPVILLGAILFGVVGLIVISLAAQAATPKPAAAIAAVAPPVIDARPRPQR